VNLTGNWYRTAAAMAVVLTLGAATACSQPQPELTDDGAARLQSRAAAIRTAAADRDFRKAIKALDSLAEELTRSAGQGDVSFRRYQSIEASLATLRADLEAGRQAGSAASPSASPSAVLKPDASAVPADQEVATGAPAVPAPAPVAAEPKTAKQKAAKTNNGKGNKGKGGNKASGGKGSSGGKNK
jgi:hypothetical protein